MNFFRKLFSAFSKSRTARKASKAAWTRRFKPLQPRLEALEDRFAPSATPIAILSNSQGTSAVISGHVYFDANNNGLMDQGELPLANTPIQLKNAQGTVIGSATTDANGFYQFSQDNSVNTASQTITRTLTFPAAQTDYAVSGVIGQFDPSLGTLVSVKITNSGSITSDIKVENTGSNATSTISGTVSGNLTLTGPNGLSIQTNLSQYAGSFTAAAFDGQVDFGGTSGADFGSKTANGSQTTTLTGNDIAPFVGTGNVQLTQTAIATSTASGGGNVLVGAASTATADVTVVYTYVPNNFLKPGNYTIVKTADPPGYIDGNESSNGIVLNNPPGANTIPVTLTDGSSVNNDFAELKTSSLSGNVYADTSNGGFNDGIKQAGEAGISGVTVTLTGTNGTGSPVNLTTTTDPNGFYHFDNLLSGTYAIAETQPAIWLDGKAKAGSAGGSATANLISNINLPASTSATDYNFGEITASGLSGFVFADVGSSGFNDGVKQGDEAGISGVTMTLTGTNSQGAVNATATTDANGFYHFDNLQSGSYVITETQPAGWVDGKVTPGTAGGTAGTNVISNINLQGGTTGQNNNFGELTTSGLSGFVYADVSSGGFNDGTKQGNEAGIANVSIALTGTNAQGAVNLTTTTDANGFYQFTNLLPGTYTVTETQPAGWVDGKVTAGTAGGSAGTNKIININLAAATLAQNYNFGELTTSGLSGFVYADVSSGGFNDGVFQPDEAGIANTTMTLTGTTAQGAVNLTTTTDNNGFYQFIKLQPGSYVITESQPAGWVDGKVTAGTPGGTVGTNKISNVNLTAAALGQNNNFGELTGSGLSGFVYADISSGGFNDGVMQPGESGIANVTVTLTGTTALGTVNLTTTTDQSGAYDFDNLQPGTYTINETQPADWVDGKTTAGTSGGTAGTNKISSIVLPAGALASNYNFGELTASGLSGFVFADISSGGFNDGIMQPDEAGISGVTVTLTGSNSQGAVNLTTTTDANGFYAFNNLKPGSYTITETQPASYADGKDSAGTSGGTASPNKISNITLPAGATAQNYDFGEIQLTQISGTVFNDGGTGNALNNGVQDAGEPGISGVTVNLTGTDSNGNAVSLSTTTNAAGHYAFNNLNPGNYTVNDVQPAGYFAGQNSVGTNGGDATVGGFANIFVSPGDSAVNYNFAELQAASISGFVYLDTSPTGYDDGIKQATEQGLAGATITLTGTNDLGQVNLQQTTGADGAYSFAGLRPGTYSVTASMPPGYIDGKDTLGSITTGQVGTDTFTNIVLPPNTNDANNNFGELTPSIRIFIVPPIIPPIVPEPPIFTTPQIPIVSKGQLLSSTINRPTSTVTAENAQYINSVFTSILGRSVDGTSLTTWLNYLQAGGTRQNFVNAIWTSTEHRSNEINGIYQAFLGSTPSQATVNSYVGMFTNGASEFAVAAAIAGSSQGSTLYPTTSAYVDALYQAALGRTADPSEQAAWASFNGSRTALALAIFTLPETLTGVVHQVYSQVLNRAATTTEVTTWVAQLQNGGNSYTTLIDTLFTSSEYAARMTI